MNLFQFLILLILPPSALAIGGERDTIHEISLSPSARLNRSLADAGCVTGCYIHTDALSINTGVYDLANAPDYGDDNVCLFTATLQPNETVEIMLFSVSDSVYCVGENDYKSLMYCRRNLASGINGIFRCNEWFYQCDIADHAIILNDISSDTLLWGNTCYKLTPNDNNHYLRVFADSIQIFNASWLDGTLSDYRVVKYRNEAYLCDRNRYETSAPIICRFYREGILKYHSFDRLMHELTIKPQMVWIEHNGVHYSPKLFQKLFESCL